MADIITPKVSSLVPVSELESDSRIFNLKQQVLLIHDNDPGITQTHDSKCEIFELQKKSPLKPA